MGVLSNKWYKRPRMFAKTFNEGFYGRCLLWNPNVSNYLCNPARRIWKVATKVANAERRNEAQYRANSEPGGA